MSLFRTVQIGITRRLRQCRQKCLLFCVLGVFVICLASAGMLYHPAKGANLGDEPHDNDLAGKPLNAPPNAEVAGMREKRQLPHHGGKPTPEAPIEPKSSSSKSKKNETVTPKAASKGGRPHGEQLPEKGHNAQVVKIPLKPTPKAKVPVVEKKGKQQPHSSVTNQTSTTKKNYQKNQKISKKAPSKNAKHR